MANIVLLLKERLLQRIYYRLTTLEIFEITLPKWFN